MWGAVVKGLARFGGKSFFGRMGKQVFSTKLGSKLKGVFSQTGKYSFSFFRKRRPVGTISKVSSAVKNSRFGQAVAKYYDKTPSWVKTVVSYIAVDEILDLGFSLISNDATEGHDSEESMAAFALAEGERLGYFGLIDQSDVSCTFNSVLHSRIFEVFRRIGSSCSIVAGTAMPDDIERELSGWTLEQRAHALTILNVISNAIADSGTYPGITNNYRVQLALSSRNNSMPTAMFGKVMRGDLSLSLDVMEAISGETVGLFNGLLNDLRAKAADDVFSENTSTDIFFDQDFSGDLVGGEAFAACLLATDKTGEELLSWMQSMRVDDDNPADEETYMANLIKLGHKMSPVYREYIIKMFAGSLGYDQEPKI